MKIMGLAGWVHTVGWYVEVMLVMILPVIIMAVVLKYGLFLYSDGSLLFVFLREYWIQNVYSMYNQQRTLYNVHVIHFEHCTIIVVYKTVAVVFVGTNYHLFQALWN